MRRTGTLYIEENTFFHRMDGSIKFLLFLTWTVVTVLFMDLRIFVVMLLLGFLCLNIAKIPFKVVKPLLWVMITFNIINSIFILLITPAYGTELTGTSRAVLNLGYNTINLETIMYVLTLSLKYANLLPMTMIFIFTTHPSRFASSLNKLGLPYKIAYSINIAFRYIPDIQEEFRTIVNAQEARGISFKKGEASLKQRLKNLTSILIPLVTSSLQRIEVVTNAMELRSFGKHKKRTWYSGTMIKNSDYAVAVACALFIGIAIYLKIKVLNNFWYPF